MHGFWFTATPIYRRTIRVIARLGYTDMHTYMTSRLRNQNYRSRDLENLLTDTVFRTSRCVVIFPCMEEDEYEEGRFGCRERRDLGFG